MSISGLPLITNPTVPTQQVSTLQIRSATRQDMGLYECLARNDPDPNRYQPKDSITVDVLCE